MFMKKEQLKVQVMELSGSLYMFQWQAPPLSTRSYQNAEFPRAIRRTEKNSGGRPEDDRRMTGIHIRNQGHAIFCVA
jgi:hypothetical protein